jgi:RHS repeat-associated protein
MFTGKERDAETGLDYFGARYFSGAQGRFTSQDPHNPMMNAQMATAVGLPSEAARSQMNEFLENPQN